MNESERLQRQLRETFRDTTDRSAMDKRILDDASTSMERALAVHQRVVTVSLGRRLMKNSYFKIAALLVVGCGVLSVLWPSSNGFGTDSILLADVQQRMDEQNSVYVQGTRTCTFPGQKGEPPEVYVLQVEKMSCPRGHIDKTFDQEGNLIVQAGIHYTSGTVTVLLSELKHYYRFTVPSAIFETMRAKTIHEKIDFLMLGGEYQQVDAKDIGGVRATGFQCQQMLERLYGSLGPPFVNFIDFFFKAEQTKTWMWVDPETRLPIQFEIDIEVAPSAVTEFERMHLHEIDDRIEWGVTVDEAQFFPEVPAGFQLIEIPLGVPERPSS